MPKVTVYDMAGKSVGEMNLSDAVFGIEPNAAVMHAAVVNYLANQRQGTQSTLTRAEVRGGGRKPWRQKGTGHARQGSIRAPQWTHGGIALGPKPRDYSYSLNKQGKASGYQVRFLHQGCWRRTSSLWTTLMLTEYKTKTVVAMLKALGAEKKALIVMPEKNEQFIKSAANIPGVKTALVNTLNAYDVLNCRQVHHCQGRRSQARGGVRIMKAPQDIIHRSCYHRRASMAGHRRPRSTPSRLPTTLTRLRSPRRWRSCSLAPRSPKVNTMNVARQAPSAWACNAGLQILTGRRPS